RFFHGDRFGRSFYLPPNSASNAAFLTTLRYLLVQDWEDDEGQPDTLRLLYGAPGRWLADGARLRLEGAPSRFGLLSLRVESRLAKREVEVPLDPPPRQPKHWLLRLPLPPGWKVVAARSAEQDLPLGAEGAVELPYRPERFTVLFRVASRAP